MTSSYNHIKIYSLIVISIQSCVTYKVYILSHSILYQGSRFHVQQDITTQNPFVHEHPGMHIPIASHDIPIKAPYTYQSSIPTSSKHDLRYFYGVQRLHRVPSKIHRQQMPLVSYLSPCNDLTPLSIFSQYIIYTIVFPMP